LHRITIGENVYVAAGSTVTEDIPDHALAIARSRMTSNRTGQKDKS
jgi:bifunctional UDP-N-acetylglucosamine pyrophosphorylase/glucosamine-1-phosphate N-acetyltransferase